MEAGLPNITGTLAWWAGSGDVNGAFRKISGEALTGNSLGGSQPMYVSMDASRLSLVYGASETVTPLSLSTKLILKY